MFSDTCPSLVCWDLLLLIQALHYFPSELQQSNGHKAISPYEIPANKEHSYLSSF